MDNTIYKLPGPPKLELRDGLLNVLHTETDNILDKKFVNIKEEEDSVLEQLKDEYNFDDIKDAFDKGTVPHQLELFYGGDNDNYFQTIECLSPCENKEFIAFLLPNLGQNW